MFCLLGHKAVATLEPGLEVQF